MRRATVTPKTNCRDRLFPRRISSLALWAALSWGCGTETHETSETAQALEAICGPSVQAQATPAAGRVVIDGSTATTYGSGNNNWQSVTLDLGCNRTLSGFRRHLVKDLATASRVQQGEMWEYSSDGSTWKYLTGSITFGWESYVNYTFDLHAWHSVGYGWSRWLRPKSLIKARYVRYHWDGNQDSVGEVEIDIRTISSKYPGTKNTSEWNVIDRDSTTGLETGYLNWQNVTLDLGRPVRLSRLRRHMTGPVSRVNQGEGWAVSNDGVTFQDLVGSEVTGWQAYVNYLPYAWHSVPYGWSQWLSLKSPRLVRYVRFNWDGNSDTLNEVEIDEIKPASDANYDFGWSSGGFTSSLPDYSTLSPLLPRPSTWAVVTDARVGLSGFYQGEIWSNVLSGQNSRVSATLTQDGSGEVRGVITFLEGRTPIFFDGLGCSHKILPAGTRFNVRMTPWTNDGRFTELGGLGSNSQYLYASGSTSRPISGFGISGTATFNFYAQLTNWITGPTSTLSIYVDYSTPCSDGPPLYLSLTRNNTLLRKMVGL